MKIKIISIVSVVGIAIVAVAEVFSIKQWTMTATLETEIGINGYTPILVM
jgi:hypothetical protein